MCESRYGGIKIEINTNAILIAFIWNVENSLHGVNVEFGLNY